MRAGPSEDQGGKQDTAPAEAMVRVTVELCGRVEQRLDLRRGVQMNGAALLGAQPAPPAGRRILG